MARCVPFVVPSFYGASVGHTLDLRNDEWTQNFHQGPELVAIFVYLISSDTPSSQRTGQCDTVEAVGINTAARSWHLFGVASVTW